MFKKTDPVLKISRWNNGGEFYITRAVVHSCGKQQMVLDRRDTAMRDCLGRNFRPQAEQYGFEEIRADLTDVEAEARALELSAAWIAAEIARLENLLARNPNASAGYVRAITRDRDALLAATPAFHWDAG